MNSNRYKLANKISSANTIDQTKHQFSVAIRVPRHRDWLAWQRPRNPLPIREIGGGPFWPVTGEPRAVIRRFCRSPLWLEKCRGQQQIDG